MKGLSLQEQYAADTICFGCGPKNEKGLHIKSFPKGSLVIASFRPEKHHQAFPNVLNGGIIGTILDCHCNWAAAWFLMNKHQLKEAPCTVTAEYTIRLLKPTPTDETLELVAELESATEKDAIITAELRAKDKVTATCRGRFVMVKPGHPGYFRWSASKPEE